MPFFWWVWAYRTRWVWILWSLYAWRSGSFVAWAVLVLAALAGLTLALGARVRSMLKWQDEKWPNGLLKVEGWYRTVVSREVQHRAACRIRWSWRAVVTATSGLSVKDAHPHLGWRIRKPEGGLSFRVKMVHGQHIESWAARKGELQSAWRCSEVEFTERMDRKGVPTGQLYVTCSLAGILLLPAEWPFGVPASVNWTMENLPIGVFAGGRPATINLDESSLVVGGPPGAGKSVFLHDLMMSIGLMPNQAIVIFDLKGIDFGAWRGRCAAYCSEVEEVEPVLAWLTGLMEQRKRKLQDLEEVKWQATPGGPGVTLIVDEFAELPQEMFDTVDRLARLGRAFGIRVVNCTQRPAAELGDGFTKIRAMCTSRVGLGPLMPEEAQMIIGRQNVPRQYVTLPVGCGRLVTAGQHGRPFRAYWVQETKRKGQVKQLVARRPGLTFESGTVGTDDAGCGTGSEDGASCPAGTELGALVAIEVAERVAGRQLHAVREGVVERGEGADGAVGGDTSARSA